MHRSITTLSAAALRTCLILLALLAGAAACHAQTPQDALNTALASPKAMSAAVEQGRAASFFCANCHGATGLSKYPEVPNLAGQHPIYLLNQIEAFSEGRRRNEFMQGLVKVLTPQDKAAIALFYSRQPPRGSTAGAENAPGSAAYRQHCARCHGDKAAGQAAFPRLAGQQAEYLRLSLRRYLERSGERNFAPMSEAVQKLGASRIDDVVEYLSGLE